MRASAMLAVALLTTLAVAGLAAPASAAPPSLPCTLQVDAETGNGLLSCGITVCTIRPGNAPYVVTCYD